MKKTNYSNEEINYIKEHFSIMTIKQIAENLNKSAGSIEYTIRKPGLKKQIHKTWSENELDFLKEHYMTMTNTEIAKQLNRSFNSISAILDKLGLVREKTWTLEEEDYLKQHFMEFTHEEIGKYLHRTAGAVTAKCFELSLYKKELPWTDDEIDYVRQHYMEMSKKEISEVLNRTENAIGLQASRIGMKKSPYYCDYHYFDIINTEEKAYWLGFLTADGWISKNKNSNSCAIGIELQYGDKEHLKNFNKSLSGNYKITDRWRKCPISTTDKVNHTCCIRIYSQIMYDSLINLGFSNDKSYSVCIPNIPKNLMRHYIRGYFDGDGCFTCTNRSFRVAFISASKSFIHDIVNVLRDNSIQINEASYISSYDTVMYRPEIHKDSEKIKFLNWIYKDCSIYLDRKYKKYLKAKEKYDTTPSLAA